MDTFSHLYDEQVDLPLSGAGVNDKNDPPPAGSAGIAAHPAAAPVDDILPEPGKPLECGFGDNRKFFTILGYDRDNIHIRSNGRPVVKSYNSARFAGSFLTDICDASWWERNFTDGGTKAARNWLQREAEKIGLFDRSMTRGCSCWDYYGRIVCHLGSRLLIDGVLADLTGLNSGYIYESRPRSLSPAAEPLSDTDG